MAQASLKVARNFTLKDVQFFTREDLRNLGLQVLEDIRTRTLRGVDYQGRPFARYSPGYAERKGGYVFGGPGASALASAWAVDLKLTGEMLDSNNMNIIDLTDTSVTLGFLR